MPNQRTGLVFDERFLGHDTGVQTTVLTRTGSFQLSAEPHPSSIYITAQRFKGSAPLLGLGSHLRPLPGTSYFLAVSRLPLAVALVIIFTSAAWIALGEAIWRRRMPSVHVLAAGDHRHGHSFLARAGRPAPR